MSIERFGVEAPLVVGDGQRPGLVARFDGAGDLQWAQTLGPTVVQVGPVATNTDGQTAFAVSAAAELWDGSTVGSASMVRVAAGGTIDWAAPLADGAAVTGMAIVTGGGAVWAMENGALGRFGPDGGLEWRHAVDTPEGRAWLGMSVALLDRATSSPGTSGRPASARPGCPRGCRWSRSARAVPCAGRSRSPRPNAAAASTPRGAG